MADDEEIAERKALHKGIFKPMKEWFNTLPASLQQKFGSFPIFWQDLESWAFTKTLMKGYLIWSEKKENGIDYQWEYSGTEDCPSKGDDTKVNQEPLPQESLPESQPQESKPQDSGKKRRSRWCDDDPVVASTPEQSNQPEGGSVAVQTVESTKPRKSRWAKAPVFQSATPIQGAVMTAESLQEALILKMTLQHLQDKLITVSIDG